MKRALISDVHSNLEALRVVLDDIRQQGINEIYCLGDVIGYGPNPRECLDLVRRLQVCISGQPRSGGDVRSGRLQSRRACVPSTGHVNS